MHMHDFTTAQADTRRGVIDISKLSEGTFNLMQNTIIY